jgi:DNA-binding transcriptional regulator GbsR (MarR family)
MGQAEASDFLENHLDRWYTSKEISEEIGISRGAVSESLRKLRENEEIEYRGTGQRGNKYLYKFNG